MNWWEVQKHIFAREKLRLNKEWKSNDFKFFIKKDLLWLSGTLYLPAKNGGIINFEFELKYPSNYPFSVPFIYPKGREKNWVGNHQFISSAFCLDIRDKTWNSSLSAVDIIKSLEKLLLAALDMIENMTGKLEVYEEVEPTKLDIVSRKIQCVVPYPLSLSKEFNSGSFQYYNPLADNRIIVNPILLDKEPNEERLKSIIESEYLKIWGLNLLFSNTVGIWIKATKQQLESIVFKEDLQIFKDFLINENLLTIDECNKHFGIDNIDQIIFFIDNKAELYSKLKFKDEKVEYAGCYNQDLALLNSRLPNYEKALSIKNKKVTIIGCGSAGSCVAEEFVKSGITELVLIDDEYLTVENVIRHVCDLHDIGLKKTQALKIKLQKINPYIKIECIDVKISTIPNYVSEQIKNSDIIINATADIEEVINEFCWQNQISSIHSKVYPMGFGGEIIRVIPSVTPCFECMHNMLSVLLETQQGFEDTISNKFINYNETVEGEIIPTPALSIDSKFISLFTAKMALEILYSSSLEEFKFKSNIILWGNEQKWIFKQDFECIKVKTEEFISYSNCFVCYGNKQIESELGLSEEEVVKVANDTILKNVED